MAVGDTEPEFLFSIALVDISSTQGGSMGLTVLLRGTCLKYI